MPITEADLGNNLLTIDQSAEFLGVSRSTVTRMIANRELDVVRIGSGRGMPRITKRSLLDHVNRKVIPANRPRASRVRKTA
jgi:excisionase family DNA binding protein